MLSSISPLGERARQQRFWLTVSAYIVASTLMGGALGSALGALGAVLPEADAPRLLAFAALTMLGVAVDRRVFGWRVPGPRRQVNEDWLARYRGWVYGGGFGLQLGFGFATIISTSLTYVAFACALFSANAGFGLLIGVAFGAARSIPVLATARIHEWAQLRTFMASLHQRLPAMQRTVLVTQLAAIASSVGWATGWAAS
jgi:hypothetical protein